LWVAIAWLPTGLGVARGWLGVASSFIILHSAFPHRVVLGGLTRTFHTRVAADGSRRCLTHGRNAPTAVGGYYTLSRECHVEVEGEFADAVLGRFQKDKAEFIVALEGKGTRDPLDRPFAGRRMSAVDQA
jgi:hypothetical protein